MPIDLPNLDDRRYSDLVEEALRLIPTHAPEWTNHNPSDPGITLIELLAYLTEVLIYRLNRVTPDNTLAFLKLLNGPGWNPCCPELNPKGWEDLGLLGRDDKIAEWWTHRSAEKHDRTVADTVRQLRKPLRAVASTDFEALAREGDEERVARVHCIPGNTDGHIRLIVVPNPEKTKGFDLPKDLKDEIHSKLRDSCLLTTQLDVEGPKLAKVGIQLTLVLEADTREEDALDRANSALTGFLDPLTWPFGQAIYPSKLTALFADLPGIRDVRDITLTVIPEPPVTDPVTGNIIAIPLDPDTLAFPIGADKLAFAKGPMDITIKRVGA